MNLPTLKNLDVANKTVLVRTGFDAPLLNGKIEDEFRLKTALPTLDYLAKKKAKIVIISHLDRPTGWDLSLSLRPVAEKLSELWKRKLAVIGKDVDRLPDYSVPYLYFFEHNILEDEIGKLIQQMRPGDTALLENIRFYPEEEKNDESFGRKLASLGEAYVNEAFSDSHRAHASIARVPEFLPAAAGLEFDKEISALTRVSAHPKRPVVLMLGGAKSEDKLQALTGLIKFADFVLLGGGLANMFLLVQGFEIGKSIRGEKKDEVVIRDIWRDFKHKIKLPLDVVVSQKSDGPAECVAVGAVKPQHVILDVGPQTILSYSEILKRGQTLIWNGPLGYIENKTFAHGTQALARLLASRTKTSVFGLVGGGETLEIVSSTGLFQYLDFVSTGGGAMLLFLAGQSLPGIEALKSSHEL